MAAPFSIVGQMLGHYRILEQIGAGGMGEVYRAQDTRLERQVAIKILPAEFSKDEERLRRFEREARAAAALNHPNILAIYDVQIHDGSPFIISELLQGTTLRGRLITGALPLRVVIDYAAQILHGLTAAHQKHIVHRDLKPENLFITRDNRVKILDFGLAKLAEPNQTLGGSDVATMNTTPGMVMGTLAYMSPEQLRGRKVDERSDIFSFGAILYEMVSANRAFQAETNVDIITAILTQDPLERSEARSALPPALERVVRHCLEKSPEDRFQSARDLLFNLEAITGASPTVAMPAEMAPARSKPYLKLFLAALMLIAAVSLGLVWGKQMFSKSLPSYHQLTSGQGTVWSARFTADAHTIIYSSSWNGSPSDIFSTRTEGTASRSLGFSKAELLAVSSSGELAVLLNRRNHPGANEIGGGTLARVPLEGGTPREVLENVQEADWSPDNATLAVVRYLAGRERLEYPIGRTLYETQGWISYPRVSPKGDRVAFLEHQGQWDDRGWVAVVDLAGNKRRLSGEWADEEGLAWSPQGDQVWFTASAGEEAHALYAVSLSGAQRVIARVPTNIIINDIAQDGSVLLTAYKHSTAILGLAPGQTKERDLSWLDNVLVFDLSADGKTFIFQYYGEGSGTNYTSYLRYTDGSPAVRLGDGAAVALSPDRKWVITILNIPSQTVLLPTGAGEMRRLERSGLEAVTGDSWFPDSKHILFTAKQPGRSPRCYMQDIDGGTPQAITPEGITGTVVSPDARSLLATDSQGKRFLFPLQGGESRSIPGLADDDVVIRWSGDGRSLYVYRPQEFPIRIYTLELATGRRRMEREIVPSDLSGIRGSPRIFLASDGKSYLYQVQRYLSELYLARGLSR